MSNLIQNVEGSLYQEGKLKGYTKNKNEIKKAILGLQNNYEKSPNKGFT